MPPNANCQGLDFASTVARPVRGATVQLVDSSTQLVTVYKNGIEHEIDVGDERMRKVLSTFPSAYQILPEFQHLEAGDVIPLGSGPSWPVRAIEPFRST